MTYRLHDVGVGGRMKRGRKFLAAFLFGVAESVEQFDQLHAVRQRRAGVFLGGEDKSGFSIREVPPENAGRGEVFLAIEAARALLFVEEVVIPGRLVR